MTVPVTLNVDSPSDLTESDLDDVGVLLGWYREEYDITSEEAVAIETLRSGISRRVRQ